MTFLFILALMFVVAVLLFAMKVVSKNRMLQTENKILKRYVKELTAENTEFDNANLRLIQAYNETEAELEARTTQSLEDVSLILQLNQELTYAHKSLEMVLEDHLLLISKEEVYG